MFDLTNVVTVPLPTYEMYFENASQHTLETCARVYVFSLFNPIKYGVQLQLLRTQFSSIKKQFGVLVITHCHTHVSV